MTIGAFILLVPWKRCTCIPVHFVSCCPLMHLIVRMLPICHPFLLKGTLTTVNGWNRSKTQLLSSSMQPMQSWLRCSNFRKYKVLRRKYEEQNADNYSGGPVIHLTIWNVAGFKKTFKFVVKNSKFTSLYSGLIWVKRNLSYFVGEGILCFKYLRISQ